MQISKQEGTRIMHLWMESAETINMILTKLDEGYVKALSRQPNQWETIRNSIEIVAKRQALVDLKKLLEANYDQ